MQQNIDNNPTLKAIALQRKITDVHVWMDGTLEWIELDHTICIFFKEGKPERVEVKDAEIKQTQIV